MKARMRKSSTASILILAVCVGVGVAAGGTAWGGEWNGPRGYIHGEWDTPLPAASVCAFNGLDEPDYPAVADPYELDDEGSPGFPGWNNTPAGGHVQSGGQIVAFFGTSEPGAVAGAIAAGEFSGFGDDCQPIAG